MDTSTLFRINFKDLFNGLIVAVLAGVATAFLAIISSPSFSIFSIDWNVIGQQMINVAVISGAAYITKKFFSDRQGKILGKIG